MAEIFDPLKVDVSQGVKLVEASAGTGKTWNIAALFARLVLLEKIPVEQILVVTFTKAATAELKTRLRARLSELMGLLEHEKMQNASDEKEAKKILQSLVGEETFEYQLLCAGLETQTQNNLLLRLRAALTRFDRSSVYTIHGFCQRVLQDFAFYCHSPLELELDLAKAQQQEVLAAQDFWRKNVVSSEFLSKIVLKKNQFPHDRLNVLRSYIGRPYLKLPENHVDYDALEQEGKHLGERWSQLHGKMEDFQRAFFEILPDLNGKSYKAADWEKRFEDLKSLDEHEWLKAEDYLLKTMSDELCAPLSETILEQKKKKNKVLNQSFLQTLKPLGDWSHDLLQWSEKCELITECLDLDLLEHLRFDNKTQKQSSNVRQYDDLLLDVYLALQAENPHAQSLSQAMAQTWQVALIDEFQDTDPLQYSIFEKAFKDTGRPLFLVGDPKQAIYSFRGADIYAYLMAAQNAQAYTINTNHRSHQQLVEAVGRLFARKQPFALENIEYQKVGAKRQQSCLKKEGKAMKPLSIRWLNDKANGHTAEALREYAAQMCAMDIVEILKPNGSYTLENQKVEAGDIAVLVRSNHEGVRIQQVLKQYGVQSVLLSRESVFVSDEAKALSALMSYIALPQQNGGLLRFVLGGSLFRYDAKQLYELNQSEEKLQYWINAAHQAMEIWQKQNVCVALQYFFNLKDEQNAENLESSILRRGDERALTNLNQLLELLAMEAEKGYTPQSLIQWFSKEIAAAQSESGEDNQLRLESDEDLVKVVTMHSSKGLQYPVVFCPFAWTSRPPSKSDWLIVHKNNESYLCAKTRLSEEEHESVKQEELSESLRLLYVALTRAQEKLFIYVAHTRDTKNNPFAYLLMEESDDSFVQDASLYWLKWQKFIKENEDCMQFCDELDQDKQEKLFLHFENDTQHFEAIEIPKRPFKFIAQSSFSGLMRQNEQKTAKILSDEFTEEGSIEMDAGEWGDERVNPIDTQKDEKLLENTIFHFPKGAKTGTCWHEILEKADFSRSAKEQSELIEHILEKHNFSVEKWMDCTEQLLDRVRSTELLNQVNLANLPSKAIRSEMEFYLHTQETTLLDLKKWLNQPHLKLPEKIVQAANGLVFHDIQGFLKGFIDLICYTDEGEVIVADYKSNHLGNDLASYKQEVMDAEIAHHHYYLQALIYAVAVQRYLQQRNIDIKTIHICYLFLRGLDGENGGVWRWRIETSDLETLFLNEKEE